MQNSWLFNSPFYNNTSAYVLENANYIKPFFTENPWVFALGQVFIAAQLLPYVAAAAVGAFVFAFSLLAGVRFAKDRAQGVAAQLGQEYTDFTQNMSENFRTNTASLRQNARNQKYFSLFVNSLQYTVVTFLKTALYLVLTGIGALSWLTSPLIVIPPTVKFAAKNAADMVRINFDSPLFRAMRIVVMRVWGTEVPADFQEPNNARLEHVANELAAEKQQVQELRQAIAQLNQAHVNANEQTAITLQNLMDAIGRFETKITALEEARNLPATQLQREISTLRTEVKAIKTQIGNNAIAFPLGLVSGAAALGKMANIVGTYVPFWQHAQQQALMCPQPQVVSTYGMPYPAAADMPPHEAYPASASATTTSAPTFTSTLNAFGFR